MAAYADLAGVVIAGGMTRPGLMPSWVTALPLWQWYGIPNTALSSVAPAIPALGNNGPGAKISSWCGATLKRRGSIYMLGAAGGHNDYAGNEVDALALNVDVPAWVELRQHSDSNAVIDISQYYLDYRPAATHTYAATQFVDQRNRMLVMPSEGLLGPTLWPQPPAGWPYDQSTHPLSQTYCFNVAAGDWDAPGYITAYPGAGSFIAALNVKHQITGDIYMARHYDYWWKWKQSTNTWTNLGPSGYGFNFAGTAMDPNRNRMLVAGDYDGIVAPRVMDLTGNPISVTFGGLGASPLTLGGYSGMIYDEVNDNFLSFQNTSTIIDFYRVDAATFYVDKPTTTGTSPASRLQGVHNAIQYVPELGGVVIANSYGGNVQFMRTSLTPSTLALAA